MILTLYQFSKKSNSTAIPGSGVTSHSCGEIYPKDKTSLESPVFQIDDDPTGYTYAKWGDRYYFIADIAYSTPIYEVHCSVDVLATYKSAIGSSNAYIERSASNYDLNIYDPAIAQKNTHNMTFEYSMDIDPQNAPFMSVNTGCYVIRFAGDGLQGVYVIPPGMLTNVIEQFAGPNVSTNHLEYIIGLTWLPISYTWLIGYADDTVNEINFSSSFRFEIAVPLYHISSRIDIAPMQVTLVGAGGYSGVYGDFRDYDPRWVQAKLGVLGNYYSIDPALLRQAMYRTVTFDPIAGDMTVKITAGNITVVMASKHIGVDRQVTAAAFDRAKYESAIFQMGTTVAGGLIAAAGASSGAGGIAAATALSAFSQAASISINQSSFYHPATMGSNGTSSFVKFIAQLTLDITLQNSCDVPTVSVGRPLYQYATISSLSGYVKCLGFSITLDAPSSERDMVNEYMNGGFFYE